MSPIYFYIQLILELLFGVMYVYAMFIMAQYKNKEQQPKKHIVLKILGSIFIVFSCVSLVDFCINYIDITFPQTNSYVCKWVPTYEQDHALAQSQLFFVFLGLSIYFFTFKSSHSNVPVKVGKFFMYFALYGCYMISIAFNDFSMVFAPMPFVILWLIICIKADPQCINIPFIQKLQYQLNKQFSSQESD